MLLLAAEAEVREYQRGHSVLGFIEKLLAQNHLVPFRGGVQLPHAPGKAVEGEKSGKQLIGEQID